MSGRKLPLAQALLRLEARATGLNGHTARAEARRLCQEAGIEIPPWAEKQPHSRKRPVEEALVHLEILARGSAGSNARARARELCIAMERPIPPWAAIKPRSKPQGKRPRVAPPACARQPEERKGPRSAEPRKSVYESYEQRDRRELAEMSARFALEDEERWRAAAERDRSRRELRESPPAKARGRYVPREQDDGDSTPSAPCGQFSVARLV